MWSEKNILCHVIDQCPPPRPHPKVYNWVRWGGASGKMSSTLRPERGRCGAADSLARGHGGSRGTTYALVPLFGVLLTVQHISDPKVTSHPEVKTAICAGVALWVAVVAVRDAHGQCAVERRMQSDTRQTLSDNRVKWFPSFPMQINSRAAKVGIDKSHILKKTWHHSKNIRMFTSYWLELRLIILFSYKQTQK